MKIIALEAENIKRLVAVEIRPDGNLVQISGKNGSGKTSLLDSIWWALAGSRNIQSAPIRKGATQARIRLDMGEVLVIRTFKADKEGDGFTTKLEVAGNVKGSPQAMLDSLLDSLAFDPLAFSRMDAKQQFETLKQFAPGIDFDKITAENSVDFSNRTEKNRRAKEERTLAEKIIVPAGIATVRVDDSALLSELAKAGEHNADIEVRSQNRKRMAAEIASNRERILDLRRQADMLEAATNANAEKLASASALPSPIDVEDLRKRIAEARSTNERVAQLERKTAHEEAAKKFEAEASELTTRMQQREERKRAAIAAAKLPVGSITFGDGVVLLNGVPFNQASDAEQLRASCELAMAGNPDLRVIRVRDGSLLDEDSLALLARMAEERDYQVWIERVGSGKVGFVMEDGHLAGQETLSA